MKIVKLKGGLGNQMFQYAYAKLLQKMTKDDVRLDYVAFEVLEGNTSVPGIEQFRITIPKATEKEVKKICMLNHTHKSRVLNYYIYIVKIMIESFINSKYYFEKEGGYINPDSIIKNSYFDGFWQSWRYVEEVKNEIIKEFVPRNELSENTKHIQEVIKKQNAVFVGVRRGDYTKNPQHYGTFGSGYYQNAMKYISEYVNNPVFYIFSNDIEWCKINLDLGMFNVIYREPNQQISDFEELMIMASCKHAIIANSTFHWWGAALINNTDKIICCPTKWWHDDKPTDIIPDNWIRISNEIARRND
jgi:hypothetical protein